MTIPFPSAPALDVGATPLGELQAVLSVTDANPGLSAHVSVQSETLPTVDGRLLYSTLDISTDAVDSSVPRTTAYATQFVGFRVWIGGTELTLAQRSPGLQVQLALGEASTWALSIPLGSTSPGTISPIAGILAYGAAPPGTQTVDISGVYRSPVGVILTVPLVVSGIVHAASESYNPGARVLRLSGVGPRGRYDNAKVTLLLPPGTGLDRGLHILRRIATQAGVPASTLRLQSAGRVQKEIQWSEADWIERGNAVLEPSARLIHFDVDGDLTNPPKARTGGRYDHVFTLRDLLAGSLDALLSTTNDAPTTVEISGIRQVTRTDECGIVTKVQVVETYRFYAPVVAAFKQDGAGTLGTPGPHPFSTLQFRLVRLLYTEERSECGDVISERTIEAGWFNPRAARYTLASDGTIGGYVPNVYIADSSAVKDDGAQAFAWAGERFVTTRDERRSYTYDGEDYLSDIDTQTGGWVHRRAPVKDRTSTPGVPWEDQWVVGQEILANGEGVADRFESRVGVVAELVRRQDSGEWTPTQQTHYVLGGIGTLGHLTRAREEVQRAQEFETGREVELEGWSVREATGDYWYDQGGESDDAEESYGVTGSEVTTYIGSDEGSHDEIFRRYDDEGQEVEAENRRGLEGYLPAAEKRSFSTPGAEVFEDGEPASEASLASREEAQRVEGVCSDPNARRPSWTLRRESEYAESPAECELIACTELRLLSALKASFAIPVHFYVKPGQRALLRLPGTEIAVHVKRVGHQEGGGPGQPSTTQVGGDCYVV